MQRKVVTPNDFHDLTGHYNFTARPPTWQYTTHDLNDLLARLATHTAGPPPATA